MLCYFHLSVINNNVTGSTTLILAIDAAYRFYKTKCEDESLKRSGKAEVKKVARRRQERINGCVGNHTVVNSFKHVLEVPVCSQIDLSPTL